MPTSHYCQISKILDLIVMLDPKSALDIGVGFGKYGMLCREYLELWNRREGYDKFMRKIDGVEVFDKYITPMHRFVYNNIYIGDASSVIDKLDFTYDLVLLIDVLEHLSKTEAIILVNKLLKKHKGVLISVPKDIGKKWPAFNNPYEVHKEQWSKRELSKIGNSLFIHDASNFILFIGAKDTVKKIRRARCMRDIRLLVKRDIKIVRAFAINLMIQYVQEWNTVPNRVIFDALNWEIKKFHLERSKYCTICSQL